MVQKKAIPIGLEFYKEAVDREYYYVDKTLLICDLLDQGNKVTLFARPRRFGKTLAQSMLAAFFEQEIDREGNVVDNSRYFMGRKIMDAGERYTQHMGKYPVIFLSLKSAKQGTYEMAYRQLCRDISGEFRRHAYLLNSGELLESEKAKISAFMDETAEDADYASALKFLSTCLEKYHKRKTIILLDEYDVPLENAYFRGFYDEMVDFIRSLFESALKTNESLQFAVVTGCLRISKESIFTGLNNLKIVSILDESFAEYFGFVQSEVDAMLEYYEISERREEVRSWYDGYLFGQTEVYNPWSAVNYVYDIRMKNTEFPKPYWSNTSSNSIIHSLIERADNDAKKEIENLIAGGTIEKTIHEDITYEDIYKTQENLWNFLFFTGYLKTVGKRFDSENILLELKIPNREIRYIYNNSIMSWFQNQIKTMDFTEFYQAIAAGDCEEMEDFLKLRLRETISYLDSAESFYHGFLLGMLSAVQDYQKTSNRESGEGRSDIILRPFDEKQAAIIFELKNVKKFTEMDAMCDMALKQIEDRHYDAELLDEGYTKIEKYGICFCKKSCRVKRLEGIRL